MGGQPESGDSLRRRKPSPSGISPMLRSACWAIGLVFGGLGTYAVFATENQVGTGALLILSALFLIVGITGKVPQRLQVGENSVEWPQEVVDAVTTAIEEGPPEVAEKVISAIAETSPGQAISIAIDSLTASTLEDLAHATLTIAAAQLEAETGQRFSVERHAYDSSGPFDLAVRYQGASLNSDIDQVPVAVKRIVNAVSLSYVKKLTSYVRESYIGHGLVMIYGELSLGAKEALSAESGIFVIEVGNDAGLEQVVSSAKQHLREVFLSGEPR